jgi:ribosomal protein S18 acetylase RimI-like enzyme
MGIYKIIKVDLPELRLLQKLAIDTFVETYGAHNTAENMQRYLDTYFSTDRFTQDLQDPNSAFYGSMIGGQMVGYLKVNIEDAQTEQNIHNAMEVERIYISAAFKGQGLGKEFIQQAITIAQSKQVDVIWLGVWEKNPNAIAFYQQMGFAEFDRHVFQLGDELQDDIMMCLKINHSEQRHE